MADNLIKALREVIKPDALPQWLETPNEVFQGAKPGDLIGTEREEELWRMIYFLESGTPS